MGLRIFIICHREEFVIHRQTADNYYFFAQVSQESGGDPEVQIKLTPENRSEVISTRKCKTWDDAMRIVWRATAFFEPFEKHIFSCDDFYKKEKIYECLLNFSATL